MSFLAYLLIKLYLYKYKTIYISVFKLRMCLSSRECPQGQKKVQILKLSGKINSPKTCGLEKRVRKVKIIRNWIILNNCADCYTPATGFTGAERIMSRPDHSVTLSSKIVSHFWVPIVRFSPKLASGFVYHPIRRIRSHFGPSPPRPPQSFVESGSKIEKCE